jgi:NADH-quinone oxidoreductase subunit L
MTFLILIPLLPLAAVLILVLGKPWLGEQGHKIGIPAMALSFAFSTIAFAQVVSDGAFSIPLYRLIQSGDLVVDLGLYVDQLTVLLLLLVTGVSSVVHVYSSRYMIGDPRYNRFFAVIALFTFSMIMLVMSNNLLMMYVFWEIMGICSYLLIAHWGERKSSAQAATKAFLVNSVADVGLGFGVILTYSTFGTLDIQTILAEAPSIQGTTINLFGWLGLEVPIHVLTLITLFLFMGAMGKSAQVPFHVWLPFAMEAPTPVSALIHAATMVNAGPFLLVRMSPLVIHSPVAMTFIAVIGAITALYAALASLTQSDIKRMLAFSTIGQIGFMIMTCGMGAFVVSIFHMLAHGCLKGFLFLSTGNALRSVGSHEHELSSFPRHTPSNQSLWPLVAGSVLLACLPPVLIFSGPYEQLWMTQHVAATQWTFYILGFLTVFFTAVYVFRAVLVLFLQSTSSGHGGGGTLGEVIRPRFFSPVHLLGILVGIGVMGSLLLVLWSWFAEFLSPVVGHRSALMPAASSGKTSLQLILSVAVAIGGVAVGYLSITKLSGSWFRQSAMGKRWYVHFLNKLYFDEMYEAYVVQPTVGFAKWLWQVVDRQGFDALIMGIASVSVMLAKWLWRVVDLRGIDGVVVGLGQNSVGLAGWLWRVVDLHGIDRVVVSLGQRSVGFARWLWRVVDLRGVDRVVVGVGKQNLGIANWLWKMVEVKVLDKNVSRVGDEAEATGDMMRELEPRTLQHHLLVMIFWLIVGMGLLFWFVV